MKVLEIYDDLDWARSQTKTPAQHTVTLSYNGGTPFEVDVGEINKKEIDQQMAELRAAGREVSSRAPSSQKALKPRAYGKAMREWTDANDLRNPNDETKIAYITPGGGYYPPQWLVSRFEEATGITKTEGK